MSELGMNILAAVVTSVVVSAAFEYWSFLKFKKGLKEINNDN